jgi:hypothetical protein
MNATTAQHGAAVAFYERVSGVRANGKQALRATRLFPLDAEHLPLIGRLIASGQLLATEYGDVLDLFLSGVALPAHGLDARDRALVASALERLAEDPSIPEALQRLARVERTRLGARADGPPRSQATGREAPSRRFPAGGTSQAAPCTNVTVGEIMTLAQPAE